AYGGAEYSTPNIDALANRGVRFDHGYATPLCTPTRTQIMTGMSNLRNYERFNIVNPDSTTFGHVMQDAGYATTIAGKWQLFGAKHRVSEGPGTGLHPDDAGFDSYMLWQVEQMSQGNGSVPNPDDRFWGPYLHVNDAIVDTSVINGAYNNDGSPISGGIGSGEVMVSNASIDYQKEQYASDLFVDHINGFVSESVANDEPFFVYYPMLLTHDPFQQTPDSPGLTDANRYSASNSNFGDMVEYMDTTIGNIVAHLEAEGVRDNTMIVFLGDNGTKWTITSDMLDGSTVTGGKRHLIDEGTHVPFIVSWSGEQDASVEGTATDALVDVGDLMATLADAGQTQLPTHSIDTGEVMRYDSTSFVDVVKGDSTGDRDWLYMYYDRHGNGISNSSTAGGQIQDGEYARTQKYKLYGDENGQGFHANQLFDMQTDPNELNPLDLNSLTTEQAAAHEMLSLAIDMMRGRLDPVAGDANGDFRVDEVDLSLFNAGDMLADFDDDGSVNDDDFQTLVSNYGLDAVDIALAVDAAVYGDYNNDGFVNAADYTTWRDSLGAKVALPNEFPGVTPGVVTAEDYTFWRSRFGATVGSLTTSASVVPEPACSVLLVGSTLLGVTGQRWRRRKCSHP
ncbi:MAG: sulfatase-like hydrolase/transferase, partial [Aeoliella sp.]